MILENADYFVKLVDFPICSCGGVILLNRAREVLQGEFPDLAARIQLNIPDESSRRVGQSIAAASLPE